MGGLRVPSCFERNLCPLFLPIARGAYAYGRYDASERDQDGDVADLTQNQVRCVIHAPMVR